ncbi:hypothetical protein HMPREF3038_00841 [Akkermansia sp. KLE1797]|nr:hypothetical protein HMPREF3038_00841 [Akkermansia sp. KLE1797]KXU54505.1 hypothetical protein HMPREF3039_01402 [Akkermansia sp. KLE1798]KZA04896.1 hypothetical protein HMPREF1326_01478 [Akkermansia sp. KLE1605]
MRLQEIHAVTSVFMLEVFMGLLFFVFLLGVFTRYMVSFLYGMDGQKNGLLIMRSWKQLCGYREAGEYR